MQTDPTVNLIITATFGLLGTALGFIVTVTTTYISHRFEEKRIVEERKNRLDDEQRIRRLQIMQKRIDEGEEFIKNLTDACIILFDYETKLASHVIKPNSDEGVQILKQYDAAFDEAMRKQSNLSVIGDNSLSKDAFDLTNTVIEELGQLQQLEESITNHTFSQEQEQSRLSKFYAKVNTLKTGILKKLDELSTQQ